MLYYAGLLALAASAVHAQTPTPPPLSPSTCYPEYLSVFHWLNNGRTQEYSYDLRTLCGVDRFFAYPIPTDPTRYWYFFWQVGGNVSRQSFACNPVWFPTYFSGGSFIQTYDWDQPTPTPAPGWPATDPETGQTLQNPSYPCIIFAHTRPEFDLLDESNPATGGLRLSYLGLTEPESDTFNACPYSPVYSGERPRVLRVNLLCDPAGSVTDVAFAANPATPTDPTTFFAEVDTCVYELTVSTKAACGAAGDPYGVTATAAAASTPGANFGFTVLGASLTTVGYAAFLWLDRRGYVNALRARLPTALGGRAATGYTASSTPSGSAASSSSFQAIGAAYGSA